MSPELTVVFGSGNGIPDYETYDFATAWQRRSLEDFAERMLVHSWARGGESCLDLGGGFGRITQVLEPLYRRSFMLDYSKRNLIAASRRLRKTTLVRCELGKLPFEDDSFEFISLIRVMHHIREPSRLLAEVARVGRDSGTFVMSVPNPATGQLKNRGRTDRQAVGKGPQGHAIFPTRLAGYVNPNLQRMEIRGVGLFDNRIGATLERLSPLASLDVRTSRLWPAKSQLFLRFVITKDGSKQGTTPAVLCDCGGRILEGRCEDCGRSYGPVVDLVEGGGASSPYWA